MFAAPNFIPKTQQFQIGDNVYALFLKDFSKMSPNGMIFFKKGNIVKGKLIQNKDCPPTMFGCPYMLFAPEKSTGVTIAPFTNPPENNIITIGYNFMELAMELASMFASSPGRKKMPPTPPNGEVNSRDVNPIPNPNLVQFRFTKETTLTENGPSNGIQPLSRKLFKIGDVVSGTMPQNSPTVKVENAFFFKENGISYKIKLPTDSGFIVEQGRLEAPKEENKTETASPTLFTTQNIVIAVLASGVLYFGAKYFKLI